MENYKAKVLNYISSKGLKKSKSEIREAVRLLRFKDELGKYYINDRCKVPFDIEFLINHIKIKHRGSKMIKNPDMVIEIVEKFCDELSGKIFGIGLSAAMMEIARQRLQLAIIVIFTNLKSKVVVGNMGKECLLEILDRVEKRILRGIVAPGEQVGNIAATSISQDIQQLTLNTFHYSGHGATGKVVQNMNSMFYILNVSTSHDPTFVSNVIRLPWKHKGNIKHVLKIIKKLNPSTIGPFINAKYLIQDDKFFSGNTFFDDDKVDLKNYVKNVKRPGGNLSLRSLRIVLTPSIMYEKKINIYDVMIAIMDKYSWSIVIPLGKNRLRIYIKIREVTDKKNELELLQEIYEKIDNVKITGHKGILGVEYSEIPINVYKDGVFKRDKEYVLFTKGVNFSVLMKMEDIDVLRTTSNDVIEIYKTLGIEAARRTIKANLMSIFKNNGITDFNDHYFHVLVDFMTFTGGLTKIDHFGMKKFPGIEVLQKASFERIEDVFKKAALFTSVDNLTSPSSNVMVGGIGPYASGKFDILINKKF